MKYFLLLPRYAILCLKFIPDKREIDRKRGFDDVRIQI